MEQTLDNIRNFCIIAHVDHGKTTLSDRILELTKAVPLRELKEQSASAASPSRATPSRWSITRMTARSICST